MSNREEFESWYVGFFRRGSRENTLMRDEDGDYEIDHAWNAWETWQAATEAAQARIAELDNQLFEMTVSGVNQARTIREQQLRIAELEAKLVESSDLINTALNVLHIAWKRHDYVLNMPITDEQAQSHYDGATKLLNDAIRALEDE